MSRRRWSGRDLTLPLLIGGATTSRVHTAVKIHPHYRRGQAVYVNDASRAVGVVAALLSREARRAHHHTTSAPNTPASPRRMRAAKRTSGGCRSADARENALKLNWSGSYVPPVPRLLGTRSLGEVPISELIDYIDWSPFFATWELAGKYPAILDDAAVGEAARSLFADAQEMLQRMAAERWFRARAVIGFFPANSEGDDILIFADETRREPIAVLHTLRQQLPRREGRANRRARRFCRPARERACRLYRRIRRDRRNRRGGGGRTLQARQRRLFGDHGQGARRSARRSAGRTPAPARAPGILGLCARRDARHAAS